MSLRLCPAQKALPWAASTTTRACSSLATASSADCRATSISLLKALKRCASLSVMRATPRSSWLSCTKESLIAVTLLSD
jgi:hypothetical protein